MLCFKAEKLDKVSSLNLSIAISYIFTLIGLTRIPDESEMFIIEDYIRTTYFNFTIDEFRLAFKLATQGKLACEVEHYEKFSPKFISQVMNAYKVKANQVRKIPIEQEQKPIPKLTDDEIVNYTREDWHSHKEFRKIFNANRVFYIILNRLQLTPKDIKEIIQIVNEDNEYRLKLMGVLEAKEFKQDLKNQDFIDHQCKQLALAKYFNNENMQ